MLSAIYERWIDKDKILFTNLWSSELSKLSANAFLAQRISSINSISEICEKTGAEILEVSSAIGLDKRIGQKFLNPGPGFGGSCFQKDILNLVYLARFYGLENVANYWEQVVEFNKWQRIRISKLIVQKLFGTVSGKKIAILGFSFKANTNDTRESPAIYISKDLIANGAKLVIHDPKVSVQQIENSLNLSQNVAHSENNDGTWSFVSNIDEALDNADAAVILTEWDEYSKINWRKGASLMRKPAWLFDTRNILKNNDLTDSSINYWALGNGNFI